ncbi:hypothetical protein [Devriesea agamarum]|nr:hypothetical protein [Devriesea agamarum]
MLETVVLFLGYIAVVGSWWQSLLMALSTVVLYLMMLPGIRVLERRADET